MTKREVVRAGLNGEKPPYVLWSYKFTQEPEKAMQAHLGCDDLEKAIGNHIVRAGSDIGFFDDIGNDRLQDVFGVIWDRSVDIG